MSVPRRRFCFSLAAGAGAVAVTGCRPGAVRPGAASLGPERFATPATGVVDLATHILDRTSFGRRPGDREALLALASDPEGAVARYVEAQLDPSAIDDSDCTKALRRFASLAAPLPELYEWKEKVLYRELASATLLRAVLTRRQLEEVMVQFWSDHFNIDVSKAECAWLKAADDRDVIRKHALGRFGDLLAASAKSPAMLWYLDGRENRKRTPEERPNENYARELLELHTLGVHGGYTQRDVMEAARCLTGFTVRSREGFRKGEVEYRPEWHDDGAKVVLGQTIPAGLGREDLPRLLAIVSSHPSTATHLAGKLCRRFIADEPRAAAVSAVASAFSRSGGDVRATLRALLSCPELLAPSCRGTKVKRPFHFVASALRATAATTDAGRPLLHHLEAMGQAPFSYPTPDGYPEEPWPWLGTLLWRFKLAAAIAGNRIDGTRLDARDLLRRAGGPVELAAHLLGRLPSAAERAELATLRGTERLALLLSSPSFQRY